MPKDMEMVTTAEDKFDMGRHSHKVRKKCGKFQQGEWIFSALKMDAVGFGVLHVSIEGFF